METNKKRCVIVIPTHKNFKDLEDSEVASLVRLHQMFWQSYDIRVVTKHSVDLTPYKIVLGNGDNVQKEEFENLWFNDYYGYNQLLESECFYSRFKEYEYMLIYQLDCWILFNELDYWCDRGYDYIGPPVPPINPNETIEKGYVLNGGFSLRKIKSMILYCRNNDIETFYEDRYFDSNFSGELILPTREEAAKFAMDNNMNELLQITHKLPFGCHAFLLHDWNFWKDKINLKIAEQAYLDIIDSNMLDNSYYTCKLYKFYIDNKMVEKARNILYDYIETNKNTVPLWLLYDNLSLSMFYTGNSTEALALACIAKELNKDDGRLANNVNIIMGNIGDNIFKTTSKV